MGDIPQYPGHHITALSFFLRAHNRYLQKPSKVYSRDMYRAVQGLGHP